MLFFGNYLHHPNPESAIALATEVLPRVRATLDSAELWLAGAQAGPEVLALGELPGVRFLGFVDDLPAVIAQARCLVAPVYSGSGVRTKSLFAMAHGLPIVANQLGLQGMDAPSTTYTTGEGPDELAAACLRFLEDPGLAAKAGAAARDFVRGRFDADEAARRQVERIRALP
jgi:glycosyltransferase involved in cell wall biosynthesis